MAARNTNLVVRQVFDAPSVSRRQLHNIALETALCSIAGNSLAGAGSRLIIRADPGCQALVRDFPRDVAIYGSDELVM